MAPSPTVSADKVGKACEFTVFSTETDERFFQLESMMLEIEGEVKELCEGMGCLRGSTILKP